MSEMIERVARALWEKHQWGGLLGPVDGTAWHKNAVTIRQRFWNELPNEGREEYPEDGGQYHIKGKDEWREDARIAIAAMREPTEAMVKAGEPIVYDCFSLEPGEGLDENPAVPTWQAMIAAALE